MVTTNSMMRHAAEGKPRLGNTEEGLAELALRMPTGRLAAPEDIADVIVFLATDDARYIIGQLIHVNGGDYLA